MFQFEIKPFFKKVLFFFFFIISLFLTYKYMPIRYKLECRLYILNTINRFFDIPQEYVVICVVLFIVLLMYIMVDDDENDKKF